MITNIKVSRRNLFKYSAIIGSAVVASSLLTKSNEIQQAFNPSDKFEIGDYNKEVLIKGNIIPDSINIEGVLMDNSANINIW